MLKLFFVASSILACSTCCVSAASPWYQLLSVPNAPGCQVLADPGGRPIQQRYNSGGARIYAVGGKACPKKFPGEDYATISTARSISLDGNFARIITKTRKLVVSRTGSGNRYEFSAFKLDALR